MRIITQLSMLLCLFASNMVAKGEDPVMTEESAKVHFSNRNCIVSLDDAKDRVNFLWVNTEFTFTAKDCEALREFDCLCFAHFKSCNLGRDGFSALLKNDKLVWVGLSATDITDADLSQAFQFPKMVDISLCGTKISDKGIESVCFKATNLEGIAIGNCRRVTDRSLAIIGGLKKLQKLDISRCDAISDNGFGRMANLPQLTELNLRNLRISDKFMESASRCPDMEKLQLSWSTVDDQGMKHIVSLQKLKKLEIMATKISAKSLEYIGQLKSLECLEIQENGDLSSGIHFLKEATSLTTIYYDGGCSISAEGIKGLQGIKSLTDLYLGDTHTQEERERVQESLPNVRVY